MLFQIKKLQLACYAGEHAMGKFQIFRKGSSIGLMEQQRVIVIDPIRPAPVPASFRNFQHQHPTYKK
jgi:hypothetical protein